MNKYEILLNKINELKSEVERLVKEQKNRVLKNLEFFDRKNRPTKDLRVAKYLKFGRYNDLPIIWEIVEWKNNQLMLISKHILTTRQFDENTNVYELSEIKKWLENEFYNDIFSSEEKTIINSITLPSNEEIEKFYPTTESRIKTGLIDKNFSWLYWLRSPNSVLSSYAWNVSVDGDMDNNPVGYYRCGVVPVLHINLIGG